MIMWQIDGRYACECRAVPHADVSVNYYQCHDGHYRFDKNASDPHEFGRLSGIVLKLHRLVEGFMMFMNFPSPIEITHHSACFQTPKYRQHKRIEWFAHIKRIVFFHRIWIFSMFFGVVSANNTPQYNAMS